MPDVEGQPNTDQLKILIQKALTERFGLVFHHEDKELSVYVLSVGKGGPKMKLTADKPSDLKNFFFRKLGSLTVTNSTMQDFCNGMQFTVMDKPVVDHTGLTDRYDFKLTWTPDESQFTCDGGPQNPAQSRRHGLASVPYHVQSGAARSKDGSGQSDGAGDGHRQGGKARRELDGTAENGKWQPNRAAISHSASLKLLRSQPLAEGRPQVVAFQRKLDRGLQEAKFIAGIVALSFIAEPVHLLILQQRLDAIGKL